jgi:hypothetical protein
LRAKKSNLQKRVVSTATTAGADELDPIFQLCDRAFKPGPINFLKEPSGWLVKRSLGREGQLVEETHDSMAKRHSRLARFAGKNICVQPCLRILLEKIKTIFLRKGEFMNPFLSVGKEFL